MLISFDSISTYLVVRVALPPAGPHPACSGFIINQIDSSNRANDVRCHLTC